MTIAVLGAYRRDFMVAVPIIMQFWLFASPVIYPLSSVPERFKSIYVLNPMVGILESYRNVLVRAEFPYMGNILYASAIAVFLLVLGYNIFKRLEGRLADVI